MGRAGLLLLPALWHLGTGTSTQSPAWNLSSSLTGRVLTSRNISTVTPAPGLAELPSHRHNEPDIPSSGTKEIAAETTSPSETNIGGSSVCQTVCSVGWPATSLLSLGACVGSLVAPAITAETALTVCPAVMIALGAAKGVFDPSLCPSLCGNMTAAARRVDSAQLTESLYDMTGLYVHPEYSVLSPAIYLARVLGGLALSLQEEDKPENRILPGSVCEAVCSLGQPVARAAAVASCGASLRIDTFTGSSFMESDLTKPSVVCPLVTLLLGVSSTLVSPTLCTGTCRQVQARMPPPDDMMPILAILAGAASLYMKGIGEEKFNNGSMTAVAASNTEFSTRLYNLLRTVKGNIIMSPFSISAVMAMVSAGARGRTLAQLTKGMSFPPSTQLSPGYRAAIPALRTDGNFTLETANSIFTQAGSHILPEYRETLREYFRAGIEVTDFSQAARAAQQINDWVEAKTRNKIQDLIQPEMLDTNTSIVLVNAIYFKGDWATKFDPRRTRKKDFRLSDGGTRKVSMMQQGQEFHWARLEDLSATMLELPYKGDRLVMQILLPIDPQGLAVLEDRLMNITDLEKSFRKHQRKVMVNVQLPRFRLEQTLPLSSHMEALGMTDMFNMADFSGIDGTKQLYISTIVQKAFIEVNEEGSEAAAATAVVVSTRSATRVIQFRADHPFLFFLKDKMTGMLLFQGRMEDPAA